MMSPEIGKLLDYLYGEIDTLITDDGDVYISIHTVDMMNAIIENSINRAIADGAEISNDCLYGVMWVASLYTMLHDTMELKGTTEPVPDTPELLVDGDINE